MIDPASHIRQAREWLTRLQTRAFSSPEDVKTYEGYMLRELKDGGATLCALDPDGKSDDSAMAREVETVRMAAYLRSARQAMHELENATTAYDARSADYRFANIRKLIEAAGLKLTALDPDGKTTEAEIEERFKAAKRRICLQKARCDLKEFETSTCAGWGDLTDGLISSIRENLALAGETLSALDPERKSTDADMDKRITVAEQRLQIMYVKAELAEAERETHCYSLSSAFRNRKNIGRIIEKLANTAHEPGSDAAKTISWFTGPEADKRLSAAEKTLCKLGAQHTVRELEKLLTGTEKLYTGAIQRQLKELDGYLAHIGGQAGIAAPASEAASRYNEIIRDACLRAGAEELETFETMEAPKTLKEIDERAGRIVDLFNRASGTADNAAGLRVGKDPVSTVQERMEEAGTRARDLYYAAGGKLPVMKRIRLAVPQGGAA